jgi:gamma-glutamyl phosphate reductase
MRSVEAHLVFDPGGHPALIGRTDSREALRVLRTILLEEAEGRVEAVQAVGDPILEASEEADLVRLRGILDILIPENGEALSDCD